MGSWSPRTVDKIKWRWKIGFILMKTRSRAPLAIMGMNSRLNGWRLRLMINPHIFRGSMPISRELWRWPIAPSKREGSTSSLDFINISKSGPNKIKRLVWNQLIARNQRPYRFLKMMSPENMSSKSRFELARFSFGEETWRMAISRILVKLNLGSCNM